MIAALEWGLAVSGLVAFALALRCFHVALDELRAVRISRLNGRYLAAARHHFWRSVFRAVPAFVSFTAGVWLLMIDDNPHQVDVVAKACWLFYQCAMIANLVIEWRTQARITSKEVRS